jgi:hypothetical protein
MMKANTVYEVAIGRLKEGINLEDYLRVTELVEADLRKMSGFQSRLLLAGADGLMIDLLRWNSMEEALKAMEIFPTLESARPMEAMIDLTQMQMYHMEPVYEDILVAKPFPGARL